MELINHRNYRRGLIKGYELAFQDQKWYNENKNNFCDSLRTRYPELIPKYAKDSPSIRNFLGFLPDDLVRFGYLERAEMKIGNNKIDFWIVKIPKGFSLYHSSRALELNHSNFPLIGYDNNKTVNENRDTSESICPTNAFIGKDVNDISNSKVCTYVSYYSTPYLTKGYLRKDTGFGGKSIRYAYGVEPNSKNKNPVYNDRLKVKANFQKGSVVVTEQTEGASAYITTDDTYLFILGLDDILIDRPDLGKQNMNTFYDIMEQLEQNILSEYKINKANYDRFLNLILSVGGIGTIQDNINILKRDYNVNVEEGLSKWLYTNAQYYKNNPLPTAGLISKFSTFEKFRDVPGIRFSTFEHDRPVMNMLSWLFRTYPTYINNNRIEVSGFVSSALYVFSKGKGDVTKGELFSVKNLTFYASRGYFHSELGLFFAPANLERNRNNKYDTEYSFNYLGIVQEYRKFKTTNLMYESKNGFHQGHLLEHNSWVGIIASTLCEKAPYTNYNSNRIASKDLYLLAGFLHDLGKSGECEEKAVYGNLDYQQPRMSICHYVKDNGEIIGMKYHTLPAHPSEGYEYLKGYKSYKRFTLNGTKDEKDFNDSAQRLYLEDWNKFFDHLGLNEFEKRMIRITVGAHWEFGDYLRKLSNKLNSIDVLAEEYLRKVEIFYNDEFDQLNREDFKKIIIFIVIVSIADIFGSEYNPKNILSDSDITTIMNYLPNVSLNNIAENQNNSKVVREIIVRALTDAYENSNKREIFKQLREYWERFLQYCLNKIDDFQFIQNNNYSLLFNLKKSYATIEDIKIAYPEDFPKIITFDLDQTLFAAKFFPDKMVEYDIYPDTYQIIKEVQKLRDGKTFIVLASRHYAPLALRNLLESKNYKGKENPLYYENFDFIVSRYTGPMERIQNTIREYPDFFKINGTPDEGFMMDSKGNFYNITSDSNFLDLDKTSKNGHYNLIKKRYNISYNDILAFDDDENYFKDGKGLGDAKNVFVAGVLKTGIRWSLFREGIAFYVFNKLMRTIR